MLSVTARLPADVTARTVLPGFTLLVRRLKKRGLCGEKRDSFHLRNKPPSYRKQPQYDQQTRYRKHLRTRPSGILQPLRRWAQTPRKVLARLL